MSFETAICSRCLNIYLMLRFFPIFYSYSDPTWVIMVLYYSGNVHISFLIVWQIIILSGHKIEKVYATSLKEKIKQRYKSKYLTSSFHVKIKFYPFKLKTGWKEILYSISSSQKSDVNVYSISGECWSTGIQYKCKQKH